MKLDELVDHFIVRDSESNIQLASQDMLDISNYTQQSSMIAIEQELPKQEMMMQSATTNKATAK